MAYNAKFMCFFLFSNAVTKAYGSNRKCSDGRYRLAAFTEPF